MENKLFLYALHTLKRRFYKNFSISLVLTFLVFILFSVLFIKTSLEHELSISADGMPDITLQKLQGGKSVLVDTSRIDKLLNIQGISQAVPRNWGYYFFEPSDANFIVVGFDAFDGDFQSSLKKVIENLDDKIKFNKDGMIVGVGVKKLIEQSTGLNYINFINNKLDVYKVPIIATFTTQSSIFSNDVILMPYNLSKQILEIPDNKATDIVLRVPNPDEIQTVIKKINEMYPDFRIITQESLRIGYKNIFDYESGIFITLFIVVLFAFFVLVYDKASGLNESEKSEISILKAIGWKSSDIIYIKTMENLILSISSFLIGFAFAYFYVYIFNAPILKRLFLGYSNIYPDFNLVFNLDISIITIVFFLSVCIYLGAVLIPTYKCAVIDAEEGIR